MAVPLLPGDADATLDLQQALTTIYDILGYDESIDYRQPPPGPLTAAELAWLDDQLPARDGDRRECGARFRQTSLIEAYALRLRFAGQAA